MGQTDGIDVCTVQCWSDMDMGGDGDDASTFI